jgi:nucleoporin GLE1
MTQSIFSYYRPQHRIERFNMNSEDDGDLTLTPTIDFTQTSKGKLFYNTEDNQIRKLEEIMNLETPKSFSRKPLVNPSSSSLVKNEKNESHLQFTSKPMNKRSSKQQQQKYTGTFGLLDDDYSSEEEEKVSIPLEKKNHTVNEYETLLKPASVEEQLLKLYEKQMDESLQHIIDTSIYQEDQKMHEVSQKVKQTYINNAGKIDSQLKQNIVQYQQYEKQKLQENREKLQDYLQKRRQHVIDAARKVEEEEEEQRRRELEIQRQEAGKIAQAKKEQEEAERKRKEAMEAEQKRKVEEEAKKQQEQQQQQQQQQQQFQQQQQQQQQTAIQPTPIQQPVKSVPPAATTGPTTAVSGGSSPVYAAAEARIQRFKEAQASLDLVKTDPQFKAEIIPVRKELVKTINQVSSAKASVAGRTNALYQIISNQKNNPKAYSFCLVTAATRIIEMAKVQISSEQRSAFPYAIMAAHTCLKFPEFRDIFIGAIHSQCIYTIPRYLPKPAQMTTDEYKVLVGYEKGGDGKLEDPLSYYNRMSGIMMLYSAFIQSDIPNHPHGIEHGWTWIAHLLNMPPHSISPTILLAFLQIAGYALHLKYPKHFGKLMNYIESDWLPKVPPKSIAPSAPTNLKMYINNFRKNGKPAIPDGRDLDNSTGQVG